MPEKLKVVKMFSSSFVGKLIEIFTRETVTRRIDWLINLVFKYRYILISFLIVIINPALLGFFIDNYNAPSTYLWVFAIVIPVICFNKSFEKAILERKQTLYYFIFLALIVRSGFGGNYDETSAAIVCLSLISGILFIKREYMILAPVLCFVCDFFSTQFVNEFLISTVVFYFITKCDIDDKNLKNTKKKDIVILICSTVVYLVSVFKDLFTLFDPISSNVMIWQYYNDYFNFGFVTRGLIASIRYIIMGQYSDSSRIQLFIATKNIAIVVVTITLVYLLWKKSEGNKYSRMLIMAFLCSVSFRNIVDDSMLVYFDSILCICFLLCCMMIINERGYILIPILTAIAMCIHHGFGIFLFPALFILLLYRLLSAEEKEKKKVFITICVSALIVVALFVYFQFIAFRYCKMSFGEAGVFLAKQSGNMLPAGFETMTMDELLKQCGYFPVNIKYVLYGGMVNDYGIQTVQTEDIISTVILWALMIPVISLLKLNYYNFLRNGKKCIERSITRITPYFIFIIAFSYLEVDYGRWNSFLVFSLIFGLLLPMMIDLDNSWISIVPEKFRQAICKTLVFLMMLIPNIGIWTPIYS